MPYRRSRSRSGGTGSYPNRRVLITGFSHGRAPSLRLRLYTVPPCTEKQSFATHHNFVTGDAVDFDHRPIYTTRLEIPCKIHIVRYPKHTSVSPQLLPM